MRTVDVAPLRSRVFRHRVRALDQSGAAVAVKNCTGREFIANKEKDGVPDIARCTDAADRNARS